MSAEDPTAMPPPELKARILAAARAEPSPTRPVVRGRAWFAAMAAVAVAVAIFGRWGGVRPGGTNVDADVSRPTELILTTALGAAVIAAAIAYVALARGRSMLGRPRPVLIAAIVATPIALFAWKVFVSSRFPEMMACWPERPGRRCLTLSFLVAAAPLVVAVVLRRHADPVHPRLSAAALGVMAGAFAWVLVDFWCPVAYVPHLLLGHVLPLVVITGVAALIGGRVLAVRAR